MSVEIPEFVAPSWLKDQDSATINLRMMSNLPDGIDRTEGGFAWDLTKPTALEKAYALQFHLTQALQYTHSFWARFEWLDLIAKEQAITRKGKAYAEGALSIKGVAGTVIPKDFAFCTKATAETTSKNYLTKQAVMLDDNGEAEVEVIAEYAGAEYNTPEKTVYLMYQPLQGIDSITNSDIITGGADEESDDDLRQRVIIAEREGSFTGRDADYVRWAMEVGGVGGAMVEPLWNGRGTVRVIISNVDGERANDALINRVYDYIVSPNDRSQRLAPIGATVTIDTVQFYDIDIEFAYIIKEGANADAIFEQAQSAIIEYLGVDARKDMAISYNRIRAILDGIEGVVKLTLLEIRPTSNPTSEPLGEAEFLTVPVGYFPDLGKLERTGA